MTSSPAPTSNILGNQGARPGLARRLRRSRGPADVPAARTRSRPPRDILQTSWRPTRTSGSSRSRRRTRSPRSARPSAPPTRACLAVTSTSGPGVALKSEAMGLAVMHRAPAGHRQRAARRPVDRACRPRWSRPTCCSRSSAATARRRSRSSPAAAASDCLRDCALEACRIAIEHMTPVMLLSDNYIANGSEPWKPAQGRGPRAQDQGRRSWRRPTPASYQPYGARRERTRASLGQARHPGARAPHRRSRERAPHGQRLLRRGQPPVHDDQPPRGEGHEHPQEHRSARAEGASRPESGDMLVLGWGGTKGAITSTVRAGLRAEGIAVEQRCTCGTCGRCPTDSTRSSVQLQGRSWFPSSTCGQLWRVLLLSEYPQHNFISLPEGPGQALHARAELSATQVKNSSWKASSHGRRKHAQEEGPQVRPGGPLVSGLW